MKIDFFLSSYSFSTLKTHSWENFFFSSEKNGKKTEHLLNSIASFEWSGNGMETLSREKKF
jgi:hypothetical protein